MDNNPRVSLIFVNYHSAQYLERALESLFLYEHEREFFEVIVVNNDVAESQAIQVMQQKFNFLFIDNKTNQGFGYGCNCGFASARGDIIGFINPDVLWMGVYMRAILDFFNTQPKVGIVGMMLLDEKKQIEKWSAGYEPSIANLLCNNFFLNRSLFVQKQPLSFPDWVSGGALFIRATLFSDIGGFDDRFFLYFEDVDLCREVRKRGFAVVRHAYFPITHLRGKSSQTSTQKKQFYRSQRQYFQKHRPRWEQNVLLLLHVFFRKTA